MRVLAMAAIACAAVWTLRPSSPSVPPDIVLDRPPVAPEVEPSPDRLVAQLDSKVFTASLWNPKPPPPVARVETAAPAQPSKPDITLVAVIERSGSSRDGAGDKTESQLQAALYDPADQRVRVFSPGATIRQYTIADITDAGIVLTEGQWRHELRLREEPRRPLERPAPVTTTKSDPATQARAEP